MNIVLAILAFSVLIIAHELGHFTLAKLNGVKVEEFSLGMGPLAFSIQGKETKYSLRILPIGGYVKMLGDDKKSDDPRAFNNKHPLRKLSIVIAGPIMNIILAILLFSISSNQGYIIPTIGEVPSGMPAQISGVMQGDIITEFNGNKLGAWNDFLMGMSTNKGEPIQIKVRRNNEIINIPSIKPSYNKEQKRYIVGIVGTLKKPNVYEAIGYGFKETGFWIKTTGAFFKTLFTGKASMNDVGGPISVARLTSDAAKAGIYPLLSIAAYISIQLGIFNIIPFPALDGGYIFLYIYQAITRKEIDDNKIGIVNYIGFIFLMLLMVVVLLKDILHPLKL
ncbi:MAG: site-2 protease family protein [Clostridiaceae bacterium]|nr:site-2 protease family protein [Clostridiaceae bacterium]